MNNETELKAALTEQCRITEIWEERLYWAYSSLMVSFANPVMTFEDYIIAIDLAMSKYVEKENG